MNRPAIREAAVKTANGAGDSPMAIIETTIGNAALFLRSVDQVVATPDARELRFFGNGPASLKLTVRICPERRKAAIIAEFAHPTSFPGAFAVPLTELRSTVVKVLGSSGTVVGDVSLCEKTPFAGQDGPRVGHGRRERPGKPAQMSLF